MSENVSEGQKIMKELGTEKLQGCRTYTLSKFLDNILLATELQAEDSPHLRINVFQTSTPKRIKYSTSWSDLFAYWIASVVKKWAGLKKYNSISNLHAMHRTQPKGSNFFKHHVQLLWWLNMVNNNIIYKGLISCKKVINLLWIKFLRVRSDSQVLFCITKKVILLI